MKTLHELMTLKGRAALITGGAGHIGSAIAGGLAELGADIVILDMDQSKADATAGSLRQEYGVRTFGIAADLGQEAPLRQVPAQIEKELGRLDILIHAAALVGTSNLKGWAVPFAQQSAETWDDALRVNLTSSFILSQACADLLATSGKGSIINLSSIYGMVAPDLSLYAGTNLGNPAAYAASKAGLLQLTKWLSTVLAPKVRVNAITPGGIWRGQAEAFVAAYTKKTPLARMGTEEDLKGAAAYLASDLSAYVTGHNLVVDGGWTAW
ncbi:MAG: short-chain dehydrogenase [Verrucomicrobia bacterium Tous-C9LFEB]|nr:MAG: short-chain dehydrogenase [Verrucomicrobia bacterium Tous-C9LFEB]